MKHIKTSLLALFIMSITLTSCHFPGKPWAQVKITNLEEGQSVPQYTELNIQADARASQGVGRIELYINGELESQSMPPMGHPHEFSTELTWLPLTEGQSIVSVIAVDRNGTISEPKSIILNVGPSEQAELTTTPTPDISPEEIIQTQTAQAGCTNNATFIEHVTIPNGAKLPAGSSFTKIWRVNNNGTCDWTGYQLTLISGNSMDTSSPRAIPVVKAGANADIVVDMKAPATAGTFSAIWRIQSNDSSMFGPDLPITINVTELPTKTSTPTQTPTVKPTFTPTATLAPTFTPTSTVWIPLPTFIPPILIINSQQFSEELTISGNSSNNITVSCPAGGIVVSGGYSAPLDVQIWHSMKDGNGWRVYASNKSSEKKIVNVTASCLFNSGGSTDQTYEQVNIDPSGTTDLTVACPSGSVVTGGGWVTANNSSLKVIQSTKSDNGWLISVDNNTTSAQTTNVYAVCLSGASGNTTQASMMNNSVLAFGSFNAQTNCPTGTIVTGGGFNITKELTLTNTTMASNGWVNYVRNLSLFEKKFDSFAICYQP